MMLVVGTTREGVTRKRSCGFRDMIGSNALIDSCFCLMLECNCLSWRSYDATYWKTSDEKVIMNLESTCVLVFKLKKTKKCLSPKDFITMQHTWNGECKWGLTLDSWWHEETRCVAVLLIKRNKLWMVIWAVPVVLLKTSKNVWQAIWQNTGDFIFCHPSYCPRSGWSNNVR